MPNHLHALVEIINPGIESDPGIVDTSDQTTIDTDGW